MLHVLSFSFLFLLLRVGRSLSIVLTPNILLPHYYQVHFFMVNPIWCFYGESFLLKTKQNKTLFHEKSLQKMFTVTSDLQQVPPKTLASSLVVTLILTGYLHIVICYIPYYSPGCFSHNEFSITKYILTCIFSCFVKDPSCCAYLMFSKIHYKHFILRENFFNGLRQN